MDDVSTSPVGFDPFEITRLRSELRLMKFLSDVSARLTGTRDAESAIRFIVRACKDHFDAAAACFAVIESTSDERAAVTFALPQQHLWDGKHFADVIRGTKPAVNPRLMFARIRRRERGWGLLALHRSSAVGEF